MRNSIFARLILIALVALFIFFVALPTASHAQVTFPNRGGTGTSTIPTYGQVLMGQSNGTYAPVATSVLNISGGGGDSTCSLCLSLAAWYATTTDALDEGLSNLYHTAARVRSSITETITGIDYASSTGIFSLSSGYEIPTSAAVSNWNTAFGWGNHATQNYFDKDVDDTADITEGSKLFFTTTRVFDYLETLSKSYFFSSSSATHFETQQTARTADDLTNNSIEDLSDVAAMTENTGDVLAWNGSAWADSATNTLGLESPLTFSAPLSRSVNTISCILATASVSGCLSSTDHAYFNTRLGTSSIDTMSELESISGGSNILISTEVDTSAELASIVSNETGTGLLTFNFSPVLSGTSSIDSFTATTSTTTRATTTNFHVSNSLNFGGVAGTSWTDFCVSITGSASLCDGSDASGGGGSPISTSTTPVTGELSFWTSASTLGTVATGTLTESATGLELSATRALVGGAAVLSITSGYQMLTTASGTAYDTFYNAPSSRITAGTGIDWTGNTLNGVYTAGDAITLTGEDFDFDGGATPSGDLGGTWATPSVTDDSHAHTGTTISGVDISSDTNLTAGAYITLTGDTVNSISLATTSIDTIAELESILGSVNVILGTEIDTMAELETLVAGTNILANTEIDTCSELAALITGETGTCGSFVLSVSPTFTGTVLYGNASGSLSTITSATTTNLRISNSLNFGGVVGTAWTDFCTSITGGSGLCDGTDATGGGSSATGTVIICASGCDYSNIQTALDAGVRNIQLKDETYAGPVRVKFSDTKITGAGATSTQITCDAAVNSTCFAIASTTRLSRIIIRDFGIDNTNVSLLGIGLDTSDASRVYAQNIRSYDFNIAHYNGDTTNSTFYSNFENMDYYASSSCFKTGGTKANDNQINTARCIAISPTQVGYDIVDAEGILLNNINAEPGSLIGTGLRVDGTSIGITVINPWFEGNATGAEIKAGAINTSIKGGRITAGTIGVSDAGTNTFLDSTLVSSNTTNHSCPSTCLGTYINTSSSNSTPHVLVGTTTQVSAHTRLALNISTSETTASMLSLNNAGGFATAPAGILFSHSSGGFPSGTARIHSNPGSGYADAQLIFSLANSSKTLTERMRIDVDGDLGIATATPESRLDVWGTSGGKILTLFSNAGSKFLELTNAGTATLTGIWDYTSAVLRIPNGTAPTADDAGEIAHDTTDNQLIVDDFIMAKGVQRIWGTTISSTTPEFVSGGFLKVPTELDGYTVTAIRCSVQSGTSKVIAVEDESGNSSEDITCTTSVTSDDGSITNATYTAAEESYIDFGATSGAVDYVSISVFGTWTRE